MNFQDRLKIVEELSKLEELLPGNEQLKNIKDIVGIRKGLIEICDVNCEVFFYDDADDYSHYLHPTDGRVYITGYKNIKPLKYKEKK